MIVVYNLGIILLRFAILLASYLGNKKAKLWIAGRKRLLQSIEVKLKPNERRVWVHAASLGEFEQGRPIIERIRKDFPQYKIVVTFFSPSGYEVRKNYDGADYIFYLPLDTPQNANRFIELIQPEKVFFIKYEFWYNFLSILEQKNIPVYLCSAIFRSSQVFFQWYGSWYRNSIHFFKHIFVQNTESKKLLTSVGIQNVTITGDTRFDRVFAIVAQTRELADVKQFVDSKPCLIAGSTWAPDEEIIATYINNSRFDVKYIVAPHEIDENHIAQFEKLVQKRTIRYSAWKQNQVGEYDVLIIDNIGMLSSLYKYGTVSYIGGGFGKGIHNILEAATFGLPVIFGPAHTKFQEAIQLIAQGGAISISNVNDLTEILDKLFSDAAFCTATGTIAKDYVKTNIGATDTIMKHVF